MPLESLLSLLKNSLVKYIQNFFSYSLEITKDVVISPLNGIWYSYVRAS